MKSYANHIDAPKECQTCAHFCYYTDYADYRGQPAYSLPHYYACHLDVNGLPCAFAPELKRDLSGYFDEAEEDNQIIGD